MAGKASVDILYTSTFLEWETWSPLPIYVSDATVVCLNGTVYVGGGLTIGTLRNSARLYSFRPSHEVDSLFSSTVTDTPTYRYGLTVYNSQLLLVGGREYPSGEITNKIFTLIDGEFVEIIPPMREKRSIPCAVSTKSSLIVAGGWGASGELSSVELFENNQWTTAPSLPRAECDMKSVFDGDQWYLIQKDRKVFYTSLPFKSGQSSWETLPNAPNRDSSAAFFGGYLLSIGGGGFGKSKSSIFAFSPSSQSWKHVANLPVPLKHSACAVSPSGNLIIIGGERPHFTYSNQVYCAIIKEKYMRDSLSGLPESLQQPGTSEGKDLSEEEEEETVEEANFRLNHVVAIQMSTIGQLRKENDILRAENYLLEIGEKKNVSFNPALIKKEPESDIAADYGYQSPTFTHKQAKQELQDLPGVEVVGHTFVMVTNSAQNFYWSDYGLKLHIPQGSLPAGVNQCVLYIAVSLAGQYQLPDSKELVSAIYWVCPNPPCRFLCQLTIEIQHCGQVNTATKFSFVQASSRDLSHSKYMFYKMENPSSFSEHSSFGSMKLDHFCGVGVAAKGSVEKKYCSNVYYLGEEPNSKKIHFVVMKNLVVYTTMVNNYYALRNAVKEDPQQIKFQSDSITLDIPKEGVLNTVDEGWKIEPLMHPAVLKSDVDSHIPGEHSVFPHCQLSAEYSGRNDRVPKLIHVINLIGAKEPFTYFRIKLDPYAKSSAKVHSTSSSGQFNRSEASVPSQEHRQERVVLAPLTTINLDQSGSAAGGNVPPTCMTGLNPVASVTPSLSELLEHVGINKDLLDQPCCTDQLKRIANLLPNWQQYAEALRLSESQILSIKSDHLLDSKMKAQRVVSLWKEANSFKATYTVLIQVCFQLENVELAKSICDIVKNLEDLSSNHFPRPPPTGSEKRRQEDDKHNEEEQLEVPPKRLRRKCLGRRSSYIGT